MRLSAPKKIVFWISVILVVIGALGLFVESLEEYQVMFFLVGYVLLALGNILKGF
jgi:hypothetical protein